MEFVDEVAIVLWVIVCVCWVKPPLMTDLTFLAHLVPPDHPPQGAISEFQGTQHIGQCRTH